MKRIESISNIETLITKYSILKSQFNNKSKESGFILELIKNSGKYKSCCNPECKKSILPNSDTYMAFDGIYCSNKCKDKAVSILYQKWELC